MNEAVNSRAYELGVEPSGIRELFAYGLARKAEIGEEKVFDFSIGNPSIPAPDEVRKAIVDLSSLPATALHGYPPAQGYPSTREAVASNLRKRFDFPASADCVYMTCGAAASLEITLSAISNPGDEVIVIAPFFPEYRIFIGTPGCKLIAVAARESDFQIDIEAVSAAITPNTKAIIINTPNNPTGAVYTRENLEELARVLHEKEAEFGNKIYLISDEPYRELTYGAQVSFVPSIYDRTIICYSWSKSLSLPGERIGYIYVSDTMDNAKDVYYAVCGAGRLLGFVCAPGFFQRVIEKCIDVPTDVEAYRVNREILANGLRELGYTIVEPDGAFYLWVKALEPDAKAFMEHAKKYELLIVPSDGFGCSGWVRLSYCVSKDTIVNSLPAFAKLMEDYKN